MRQVNVNILSDVDTGSANGSQIDSNQLVSGSFHAYFGDASANGTFKIQASNDVAPIQYSSPTTFIATNWTDIPNASTSITSGSSALLTIPNMSYRWIRAVYTRSSGGSTTVNVEMFALGI